MFLTTMKEWHGDELHFLYDLRGPSTPRRASYPVHYGYFCEVQEGPWRCRFLPGGAAKYLWGHGERHWPHPAEWLKYSLGGQAYYYSIGDYEGLWSLYGEHQLPCTEKGFRPPLAPRPFTDPRVQAARHWLAGLPPRLAELSDRAPPSLTAWLARAASPDADPQERARRLQRILGSAPMVLPPDCRFLDYDVVPLVLADGCRLGCRFCCLDSPGPLRVRARTELVRQLRELRLLLAEDLVEYAGVFLGNHDALAAGWEAVAEAAELAWRELDLAHSRLRPRRLFLFASASSLLEVPAAAWRRLSRLPFELSINVGLESPHPRLLAELGKPLDPAQVEAALARLLEVNRSQPDIEVSANFLLFGQAPLQRLQHQALVELLRRLAPRRRGRGAIYLSPVRTRGGELLGDWSRRRLITEIHRLKLELPLPTYLYTMFYP